MLSKNLVSSQKTSDARCCQVLFLFFFLFVLLYSFLEGECLLCLLVYYDYWMSYCLGVLWARCSMFVHDFKNLNAVMLPWWLKDSKDSVIDYKSTNVMPFSSSLELLSMSLFPSTEAVLLSQSAFNFPNWLFHKCLIKNQAKHNLFFDKCKMQGSGWRLKHTRCFAK